MTIEGAELSLKELQEFPIKADKVVKDAMKEASKVLVKSLKAKIPQKRFKKIVKSRVAEGKEYTFANVGLLRSKKDRWLWYRAYWKNYGTLSNRDPLHKFIYKRKKISAGWKGGIKPTHFFERAMEGEEMTWKKKFVDLLRQKAKERKLLDEK